MIPDTSQTASAAASASSPAEEDENTRFTVWSIPSKTWGSTFGSIAGPIVFRHSSCWWEAPRMPSREQRACDGRDEGAQRDRARVRQEAVAVEELDP